MCFTPPKMQVSIVFSQFLHRHNFTHSSATQLMSHQLNPAKPGLLFTAVKCSLPTINIFLSILVQGYQPKQEVFHLTRICTSASLLFNLITGWLCADSCSYGVVFFTSHHMVPFCKLNVFLVCKLAILNLPDVL